MQIAENLFEPLLERTDIYLKTSIELVKLKAVAKSTSVASNILAKVCVALVVLIFLLILSVAIAVYLGYVLGKWHYGFFIVAACYLLLGLILHNFLHQWIEKPLSRFIINQLF